MSQELRRRRIVEACLVLAALLSFFLILRLATRLTFVYDDWDLLINRRGWNAGSFLDPYHEHIVAAPALVFKVLQSIFGIGSATPYRVVATATFIAGAVLLFCWLRPRVGDWASLIAAISILFLGASFENLLWPFQIGYFASIALGLGTLIALDRDDELGDRVACGLLCLNMTASSLAFPFIAGVAVLILMGRRPRARRVLIIAIPLALYVAWYIGWGHTAESQLSLSNLSDVPKYVFDAAAGGIVGLLGLATGDGSDPNRPHLIFGQIAVVVLLVLAGLRVRSLGRVSPTLAMVVVIALSFWVLAALNQTAARPPESSRYLYPSAVFILLIAGELLRGVRIGPVALVAAGAVTIAAAVAGMSLMTDQFNERWITSSDYLRAQLGSVDIARETVDPEYPIVFGQTLQVPASEYLAAVGDGSSPGFSSDQLKDQDDVYRQAADTTLAQALRLTLTPADPPAAGTACRDLEPPRGLYLQPGTMTLENVGRQNGEIVLGRYADGYPVSFGELPPGSTSALTIPVDGSPVHWRLGLIGATSFRVCPAVG